jgi:hypothetical protein
MSRAKRPHRKKSRSGGPTHERLAAVVANEKGEIFDLEGYAAVGSDGAQFTSLTPANTVEMPHGSELMFLPDRVPVLLDLSTATLGPLDRNPYAPDEKIFPVAVFNSPGVVLTHTCAYEERAQARILPLFSYGAVGWQQEGFRSAAMVVDTEPRQDLRRMPQDRIVAGVRQMQKQLPDNRLARHLEHCALTYGCPSGKNFFLGRYEAPLPTSRACNASCLGCISLQSDTPLTSR